MKKVPHGIDKTKELWSWDGLTVKVRLRTPKAKAKGLDFIHIEVSQDKRDRRGERIKKAELWRAHFSQASPFAAKLRFSRRRQP